VIRWTPWAATQFLHAEIDSENWLELKSREEGHFSMWRLDHGFTSNAQPIAAGRDEATAENPIPASPTLYRRRERYAAEHSCEFAPADGRRRCIIFSGRNGTAPANSAV